MDFLHLFFQKIIDFFSDPSVLDTIVNNRFLMIFLVILLLKIKYATYSSLWISALINIPGTVLHETMHFLIGLFLNARPTSFSLLPHRSEDGHYVMGSVGFRNITYYNALPSAFAPLILLPIGYYFNRWYFHNININIFNYMLYILLQTIIIENAVPSGADFKVAFSQPTGIMLYGAVAVFAIIYLF